MENQADINNKINTSNNKDNNEEKNFKDFVIIENTKKENDVNSKAIPIKEQKINNIKEEKINKKENHIIDKLNIEQEENKMNENMIANEKEENKINENMNINEKEENMNVKEKEENKINKNIIEEEKEDEKNKNEIKDDNISENANSLKDDISNSVNSHRNISNSLLRINSDVDLDKIIAGKDESSNNLPIYNNLQEFKIDEKGSEEDLDENQNLNISFYLGNIFRDVVNNKKKDGKKEIRMSIYNKQLDEGGQNINFNEIINAQLNEIKDNTLSYFDKTIKEFEKRYNDYIDKMTKYVNENELKISKVFEKDIEKNENIIEFADNNIFKQFDNILEIHDNIFSSIKDHVDLLGLFLGQSDLIQNKNPLENFVNNNSNDILNSWFLNKINFQKLNFSNIILNKDLSEIGTRYLSKKKDNNFASITVKKDKDGNLSLESEFVKENLNNLEKLKFMKIKSEEINTIFKNTNKPKNSNNLDSSNIKTEINPLANKLSSLSIIESDFSTTNLIKINAPELKKLKLKRTPLSLSLKYFFESILGQTLFLQTLSLQKCSIDDESLNKIFSFLSEKPQIVESLQNISFSGNNIISVDMKEILRNDCIFKSLQYLDFSKNNIYNFVNDNFKCLPKMIILDLTDNNITNYLFFKSVKSQKKKVKSIILLCNNTFINNNKKNASDYREYLHKNLSDFKHKIKKLNLSFLYDRDTLDQLVELKISPMIKISLIKLNLSYLGMTDEIVSKFIQNNFGLLNLEELNLSNNFLSINIFHILLKHDIAIEKLISLDLSMNNINSLNIDQYQTIEKFVDKHTYLKKIKFQDSTFSQDLLVLSQIEKEKCESINNKLKNREIKFIVEKEYSILIEPLKELFEIKNKEI